MADSGRAPITTHILDTERGQPAADVAVALLKLEGEQWLPVSAGITNSDGRVETWQSDYSVSPGVYQLQFATGDYFARVGVDSFYPQVTISFQIANTAQHYHVPLLLSAFGYTTYRGS
ncbi:hydroxyisourate hydrolase [Halioxenophilus sp. WMMB6]|uniref:hydroxyisourate hydrolase n=1 Tax=Halioxenophilus sp. WMMB6 TaxID=3073815 RepID=UPI00295ED663|nr:hydroxyisourate hydrolase [Halioxenophilus sp. WMMB6]